MAIDIRPPKPTARKPRLKVPPKACDTHLHIYGPFDKFPLHSSVEERSYTPTDVCTLSRCTRRPRRRPLSRSIRSARAVVSAAYDPVAHRQPGFGFVVGTIDQLVGQTVERNHTGAARGIAAVRFPLKPVHDISAN